MRIGYNWSARFDTLPALGQTLKRTYPDVELLAEEMRPNRMPAALRAGAIDVALALYPEVAAGLAYQTVRREPIVALLSATHALAHEEAVALEALANDFLMFPRELAPRLHDFYVGLCRRAGFEPKISSESARSRWTIGTWAIAGARASRRCLRSVRRSGIATRRSSSRSSSGAHAGSRAGGAVEPRGSSGDLIRQRGFMRGSSVEGAGPGRVLHEILMPRRRICTPA